jgi:hypothetical protein
MCIIGQNKKNLRGFWVRNSGENIGPVISSLMILISACYAGWRRKKMRNLQRFLGTDF